MDGLTPHAAENASGRRLAWTQVVLASVLMLATLPGRTQGLGLVTEPLLTDLQLDRLAFARLNLLATLLGALLCLPTGWTLDRLGLRWVTSAVVLGLGLTVWRLGHAGPSVAVMFWLLLASRAFGQSALSVCSITTVARWFPGNAGWAMGVYSVLLSVWFAVAFVLVGWSVREHGWRSAWLQIAGVLLFVIVPLVALIHREPRRSPHPVRAAPTTSPTPVEICATSVRLGGSGDFTLRRALRTGAFWLFAGGAAAFNLVASGLGLFNEAVLAERGFSQRAFHVFLAGSSLLSLVGQFVCGWLIRRWRYPTLMGVALLVYASGLASVPVINRPWHLAGLAVLLGVAGGMIIVIFFSVWGDLFGQRHLGRIQGAAQMVTVTSSALGPVVFAESASRTGSYAPVLFTLAGAGLLLAVGAGLVRTPVQPGRQP